MIANWSMLVAKLLARIKGRIRVRRMPAMKASLRVGITPRRGCLATYGKDDNEITLRCQPVASYGVHL